MSVAFASRSKALVLEGQPADVQGCGACAPALAAESCLGAGSVPVPHGAPGEGKHSGGGARQVAPHHVMTLASGPRPGPPEHMGGKSMAFLPERRSLTLVLRRCKGQSTRQSLACFRSVKIRETRADRSGSRGAVPSGLGPAWSQVAMEAVTGPLSSAACRLLSDNTRQG